MTTRLLLGDCRDVLASLPAQSVQCVVTSPPYWGLRSYQGADASKVLGNEATPELFVERLVEVFRAVHRVLRDDGTLWLNLGPTWSGSGGAGGDYAEGGLREGQPVYRQDTNSAKQKSNPGAVDGPNRAFKSTNWPAKCMVPIPWMVGLALVKDGWILRSEIIWDKPAPMPESVTDRPTKSHEQILLLTKRGKYYYDAEAVKEASMWDGESGTKNYRAWAENGRADLGMNSGGATGTRNARSVWRIAPEPSPEKHFAMFPSGLPRRCILAGTSERGCCPECGAPWERELERKAMVIERSDWDEQAGNRTATSGTMVSPPEHKTVGWLPTCAHNLDPIPCTVLDPFAGTGTTVMVARQLGRSGIGIELSPDYMRIAEKRLEATPLAFAGA